MRQEAEEILRIDGQRDILPKGAETPLRIYEVGGIAGHYNLVLDYEDQPLAPLARHVPLSYTVLEGKYARKKKLEGSVLRLSKKCAEISFEGTVSLLTNLKMNLRDVDEKLSTRHFYGKVIKRSGKRGLTQLVRFTPVPPEIDAYFQAHLQYAVNPHVR